MCTVKNRLRIALPILLGLIGLGKAMGGKCGTARIFELKPGIWSGTSFRTLATPQLHARTLESEHFAFNYTLGGINGAKIVDEDAGLVVLIDSLFAKHQSLPAGSRDSAVYADLDQVGAPHPRFIEKQRQYFEQAWGYYVETLKMKAPKTRLSSFRYRVRKPASGKFAVDIGDIGTLYPDFYGSETYGITYPPPDLSIAMENDFIYSAYLDSQGRVAGSSIQSRLQGKVIRDYPVEWELGIKVTAFHEFYHAIQFSYVPFPSGGYHSWYEISAVGMEERLAPEVNDYLQYLPCIFANHAKTSMIPGPRQPPAGCNQYPVYGHGLFHMYLGWALDERFDVAVWDRLGKNGDDLPGALGVMLSQYGSSLTQVYPEYASHLIASREDIPEPLPLFSDDVAQWPRHPVRVLDLGPMSALPYRQTLPPLAFEAIRLDEGDGMALAATLESDSAVGILLLAGGDSSQFIHPGGLHFSIARAKPPLSKRYLIVANASLSESAAFSLMAIPPGFFAYPNPVTRARGALQFALPFDHTFPFTVDLLAENGKAVRSLTFTSNQEEIKWDLRDGAGKAVAPGVYYYRLDNKPLVPVLVTP